MSTLKVLIFFISLKALQNFAELWLAKLNKDYFLNPKNQTFSRKALAIDQDELDKSISYALDGYRFYVLTSWVEFLGFLIFLLSGGFSWMETMSQQAAFFIGSSSNIVVGLFYMSGLFLLSSILHIPLELYSVFVIEEKHGFNRQTIWGFWLDMLKSTLLTFLLGGFLLSIVLGIMENLGDFWWLYAWGAVSLFSLFTAWAYPVFLAPLFNKFQSLEEGELKESIYALARKVGFQTAGISIMDASKRTTHGNAYFTGLFGKKRIVLFDTLVKELQNSEVVAVLAHELGHFKLHHIRYGLLRGLMFSGGMFYLLHLFLPYTVFYESFGFANVSSYGALVSFSLWFGLINFFLSPISHYFSRKNEFAADYFTSRYTESKTVLGRALLKLRESNKSNPLVHPWYSFVYYSHPPILERLKAMGYQEELLGEDVSEISP